MSPRSISNRPYFLEVIVPKDLIFEVRSLNREFSNNTYLSCFPDIYYNVSVRPVVCIQLLGRYFNACTAIENHNRMRQYNIAL